MDNGHQVSHMNDQPSAHTYCADQPTGSVWRLTSRTASYAEGQQLSGVTRKVISRQGTHLCRLAQPDGRRAALAQAVLKGGGHQALRMRRSAVKARAGCADTLARHMATDEQRQRW